MRSSALLVLLIAVAGAIAACHSAPPPPPPPPRVLNDSEAGAVRWADAHAASFDIADSVASSAERAQLATLLGQAVSDLDTGRRALCDALDAGTIAPEAALPYCLDQAARDTALMRASMGVLADRHVTPVDQLAGGS